jgi:conjugal transfer pilus assembly protein TraE
MNVDFLQKNLKQLFFQRNLLIGLTVSLAISTTLLTAFLFLKNEKVIVVPSIVEKEFWISNDHVSATYLEQFGYFLGQLMLNKSAQSASSQRMQLLRHTAPDFYGNLNKKLMEEEAALTKQSASYTFYPVDIKVNPHTLEVVLSGDRIFYVGGKPISTDRESYSLGFSYNGSRLLLKEVKALEAK